MEREVYLKRKAKLLRKAGEKLWEKQKQCEREAKRLESERLEREKAEMLRQGQITRGEKRKPSPASERKQELARQVSEKKGIPMELLMDAPVKKLEQYL